MLTLPPSTRVFVATKPAAMRRSFDGLLALVRDFLGHEDPLSGHLFVFRNKSGRGTRDDGRSCSRGDCDFDTGEARPRTPQVARGLEARTRRPRCRRSGEDVSVLCFAAGEDRRGDERATRLPPREAVRVGARASQVCVPEVPENKLRNARRFE